jgi:hypothetical protein
MIKRVLVGITVTVFCAAIGRGIVLWLGLDAKVASMISAASVYHNDRAIGWILSGGIGLIGLE